MNKIIASAAVVLSSFGGAAFAALPADVSTALGTAATDAGTLWGLLIAVALVGVGFKLGVIGIKKAPGMVR